MPDICLLVLIGLPGSGKTTFSTWLQQQQAELDNCSVLHFCYDNYLNAQQGPKGSYKEQRGYILSLLAELISTISKNRDFSHILSNATNMYKYSKFLIICDDNNYYRSMRYKIYQCSRAYGCAYAQVYLSTSLSICLFRNGMRTACVPVKVIEQMHARLEPPNTLNSWESTSLTLNSEENVPAGLVTDFIRSSFKDILSFVTIGVENKQTQSYVHVLDLRLRGCIKVKLQELHDKEAKKARSYNLNEQRKKILKNFKNDINTNLMEGDVKIDYYSSLLI